MKQPEGSLIRKAQEYGVACHAMTNHSYDGKPYSTHLEMVYNTATRFADMYLPQDSITRTAVLAACWTHDVIEDCRQTYNDVKEATNVHVADLTYALTNEKGKNRNERANSSYYNGIRETPGASFLKLCDRIANFRYSIETNSRMALMYAKENEKFINDIFSFESALCAEMVKELRTLEKKARFTIV